MSSRPGKSIYRWTRVEFTLVTLISLVFVGIVTFGPGYLKSLNANASQSTSALHGR